MKRRSIIFCMLFTVVGGLLAGGSQEKSKAIYLFPFELSEAVTPPERFNLPTEVTNALYSAFAKMPGFNVMRFKPSNPSVQRAVTERRLTKKHLQPPYNIKDVDGAWLSVKIGREMAAHYVIAGSIDEFKYDEATKQISLTLSVDLLQVKDNKVLISSVETGRATVSESEQNNLNPAIVRAIQDATQKIQASFQAQLKPTTGTSSSNSDKEKK